jgi:hypothetical protein
VPWRAPSRCCSNKELLWCVVLSFFSNENYKQEFPGY